LPSSTSVQPWNLNLPAGSYQAWQFQMTERGSLTPYPFSGTTWEYVVRATPASSGAALITVTTTVSSDGLITVTDATATVLLEIYAAATASLAPGTYYHALWMNPGEATAFAWVSGPLVIAGAPEP